MTICQYCTPEWLEGCIHAYRSLENPPKAPEKLNTSVAFRVKAESAWGIERDILFCAVIKKGVMENLAFLSEQDAKTQMEFTMAATPQEWKKLLRKENKFLTEFMLGKITLEQGSKVALLGVAPYANILIDGLTLVELQFPDEMSAHELEEYHAYQEHFRNEMAV